MKRNFLVGTVMTFVFHFSALVIAQDEVAFYKTTTPPVIDGEIDALWQNVEAFIVEKVIVGTIDDEADLHGSWSALWDDDNFYLLVVVTDDNLFDDSAGADEHDDGLDIVFDTDNGQESEPDVNDDFVLTAEYSSSGDCTLNGEKWSFGTLDIEGIVARCFEHSEIDGYNIEISIPLENLGFIGNDIFRFGLRINDDDDGDGRDSQISWHIDTADVWNTPSALAEAELLNEVVSVNESDLSTLHSYRYQLEQNFPNPFNPQTTIRYELQRPGMVCIRIFNELGQCVKKLNNQYMSAGYHEINWNATNDFGDKVNSGVYLCQFNTSENISLVKKMLLMK